MTDELDKKMYEQPEVRVAMLSETLRGMILMARTEGRPAWLKAAELCENMLRQCGQSL